MIKLFNTLTRKKETFSADKTTPVTIYSCGLTVYSQPHIGNWVGYIYWDVLVRLLRHEGYTVHHAQNFTDVGHLTSDDDVGEDKMEQGAEREGATAWDVAKKYIAVAEKEGYEQLGLTRPTLYRATDYIDEQIAFIQELEKRGLTYKIEGEGVYFDTSKLADYGTLARLDVAGLRAGARVEIAGKRLSTDFALWKLSPENSTRDMEWESPWGVGFPGWHLECSAIVRHALGEHITIHTGGIDHISVHHTNEIAQSESLFQAPLAQFWLHNNHIKVDGRKMSKSLGNIVTLQNITDAGFSAMDYKMFVLEKQYQTEGNFTWENIKNAHNRLQNWKKYAALRHQIHPTKEARNEKIYFLAAKQAVIDALKNNLDTPHALMLIERAFSDIDTAPLERIDHSSFCEFLEVIDDLLGLDLRAQTPDIADEDKALILQRQRAREEKQWDESDAIRDRLAEKSIILRDTNSGAVWYWQ